MIKEFIDKFQNLPQSNKSMIYLMWIYEIGNIITKVFINIYIFSLHKNILDVLIYNIIFATFTTLGFIGIGILMSFLSKSIKNIYYFAYSFYIIAFLLILFIKGYIGIYLFAVIFGLGYGMFWFVVHTQELVNIKDKTRDIYSSIINFGNNLINILIPLLVAFIFFLCHKYFTFSPYLILFLILPFIYVSSFLFIKNIGDYIPKKLKQNDFKIFFTLKKYLGGYLFFLFYGFYHGLMWVVYPIIAILLLKTEINVGLFDGIIRFIGVFIIMFLAIKRNIKNRIKIMGILSLFVFINFLYMAFSFNVYSYIIFTFIGLIINPLYRISEHVFDLKLTEYIKTYTNDFYPSLIFRKILIGIGRISVIGFLILLSVKYNFLNIELVKISLVLIGIFTLGAWYSIKIQFNNKSN